VLAVRESGGITFTNVQKFSLLSDEDEHPLLRDHIFGSD
jgi:type I site-specific restriction-modification system R (restriction) subunit